MALMIAPAAGAQTAEGRAAMVAGSPPPPEFVLYSDGNITIGGDVGTDCYSFVALDLPQTLQERKQDGAQAVAHACQQLGNPSGDGDPTDAEVILSIPANAPPGAYTGTESLPNTGGLPLVMTGTLAAGVALLGFGVLMLKKASSQR